MVKEIIQENSRLLFIGDSITDVGRTRSDEHDLGEGFPKLVAERLLAKYPAMDFTVLNRGISGDQVTDLKKRWDTDCLDLQPDLVTILVGINDVYFVADREAVPTAEELAKFEATYRSLLEMLVEKTKAKIVLMEPFVLPYPADRLDWREQLDPRIQIVRRLAKEYDAPLVPLDGILNAKGIAGSFQEYTGDDGIHPTTKGHQAIADAWFAYLDI